MIQFSKINSDYALLMHRTLVELQP